MEHTFQSLRSNLFDGVLVFTSKNCGPCARLKPILHDICDEFTVPLVVLDIHENILAARELSLRGAPSVVVMNMGEAKHIHTGEASREAILAKLQAAGAI